jgi:hypothetical protein
VFFSFTEPNGGNFHGHHVGFTIRTSGRFLRNSAKIKGLACRTRWHIHCVFQMIFPAVGKDIYPYHRNPVREYGDECSELRVARGMTVLGINQGTFGSKP